jgi:hypothetical protein
LIARNHPVTAADSAHNQGKRVTDRLHGVRQVSFDVAEQQSTRSRDHIFVQLFGLESRYDGYALFRNPEIIGI